MPSQPFSDCKGIDLRPQQYNNKIFSLRQGNNCALLPSGAIGIRPALINPIAVDPNSVGLYKRGGTLRCAIPGGNGLVSPDSSYIVYDALYDSVYPNGIYPAGKWSRLLAAESFGSSVLGPYIVLSILRSDTNQVELHWVKDPAIGGARNTRISLPFQPGQSMLKLANKIWVTDPANGYIRFCASANRNAADWTTVGDAGFLAVLNYAAGSQAIQGLTVFRNQMVVMFTDSLLIYQVDANPANIALEQQLNGPGTFWPLSAANFMGDTIFLSLGGFRTIKPMLVLGAIARDDDIGARIYPLTQPISQSARAIGLWCHDRGAYVCAIGGTVYTWYNYPLEQLNGWMVWNLPVSDDYMVELNGVIYIRSGNTVYQLSDATDTDYNGTKIPWNWQSIEFSLGDPSLLSAIDWITARQTAPAQMQLTCDGVQTMAKTIPGLAPRPVRTPAWGVSRQTSIGAAGKGAYQFQGGSIEFRELAV